MSRSFSFRSRHKSYTDVLLDVVDSSESEGENNYADLNVQEDESKLAEKKKQRLLLSLTIVAVVIGLVAGFILSKYKISADSMELIGFPGELYIRMLKCLIVPLVGLSLIGAMASLGTTREGKVGLYAIVWYIATTVVAGTSGILWALIFRPWRSLQDDVPPGDSSSSSNSFDEPRTPLESVKHLLLKLFTDNIFKAAIEMDMLGIIMFCCTLGFVLAAMEREKSERVLQIVDSFNIAIQKMVNIVIWISPVGVLSLVCYYMGSAGDFWEVVRGMGLLIAGRLVGVIVHGSVVLPLIYFGFTRRNPYKLLYSCSQVWAIAFGTSSSAATLPITIKNVEEVLGVSPPIARFVCTTGATINMDSASIAYSITAVTLANAVGMDLNVVQMISIVLTSTLISIGAAALPSAGLINYIAVMATIGIPLERAIPILSPILSVDWFEDRIMTIVNVEGDVFAAATINHHTKDNL